MSVYVDDVRHPFGRMIMCHLWADSDAELLAMVDKIGVQRKWIQGHPQLSFGKHRNASFVHFDISLDKKAAAIRHGAILTDKYGPVEHTAKLRGNFHMLEMVNQCRMSQEEYDAFEAMKAIAAEHGG